MTGGGSAGGGRTGDQNATAEPAVLAQHPGLPPPHGTHQITQEKHLGAPMHGTHLCVQSVTPRCDL